MDGKMRGRILCCHRDGAIFQVEAGQKILLNGWSVGRLKRYPSGSQGLGVP